MIYLITILVSFFLLLLLGVFSGGLIFSFFGELATFGGAVAGGVIAICGWFKLVGLLVEQENIELSRKKSDNIVQASGHLDCGAFLSAKDARLGNHMMIGGIITFLSSLITFSNLNLVIGVIGVGVMVVGFIISIAAYEFPAEEGSWRRVKLLLSKLRN